MKPDGRNLGLLVGVCVVIALSWLALRRDDAAEVSAPGAEVDPAHQQGPGDYTATHLPRAVGSAAQATSSRPGTTPAAPTTAETLRDLEGRLLPGDALGLPAAQELLASEAFDRLTREVAWTYAADPDAQRSKRAYAPQLQRFLGGAAADLTALECSQRYCVGAIRGNLPQETEDGLGDAVGAGTFAVLPWADESWQGYRFVFSTDPAVREVEGILGGG